jgi:predicted RND superfamily exporter protein
LSNKSPKNVVIPSNTSKIPKLSKREKRLLREQSQKEKFNEKKENLIITVKQVENDIYPENKTKPINIKKPDSIMQKDMDWMSIKPDVEGKWHWGIERKQLNEDINEITSFLDSLKSNKWHEVLSFTTGGEDRHLKNHYQEISTIDKEAIQRWKDIGLEEYDTAFRFRLTNKKRIWGYKQLGIFYLVWWDPTHKVYPVEKKHT